jgi:hypothetical protein
MARKSESVRKELTFLVAWGVTNNFHLFLNAQNYARLAVGANWEVLEHDFRHRELAQSVEAEISKLLPSAAIDRTAPVEVGVTPVKPATDPDAPE